MILELCIYSIFGNLEAYLFITILFLNGLKAVTEHY